jgi:hypothetical protein
MRNLNFVRAISLAIFDTAPASQTIIPVGVEGDFGPVGVRNAVSGRKLLGWGRERPLLAAAGDDLPQATEERGQAGHRNGQILQQSW